MRMPMRLQIVIKLTCKTAQIHDKRAEFHCSKKKTNKRKLKLDISSIKQEQNEQ